MTDDDFLRRVMDSFDSDEIVDRLGLSSEEIVDALSYDILNNKDKFEEVDDVDAT